MNLKTWLGCCCLWLPMAVMAEPVEPVVKIDSGYIVGSGLHVRAFKGIPYAQAPIGDLRWRAPQPVKPWSNLRIAKQFSVACPQRPSLIGDQPTGEDCLTVNVWTPARQTDEKLPVLVWIHGGAFEGGSSATTTYDGAPLASQGVVVVSLNYRVGILGFMAHPELSRESPRGVSGNYGLLDMVAALQWIRRNVQQFGGDPQNVTLWGESAGATAVMLLLVMPDAKGLFHKAVANSPWNLYNPISHMRDSWYGRVPAEEVGAALGPVALLRTKSTDDLLKMSATRDPAGERERSGEIHHHIVDGVVIPDDPARLFDGGRFHNVPLLAGTNADEGTLFSRQKVSREQLRQSLLRSAPDRLADKVLAAYEVTDENATAAAARILGDTLFVSGTRAVLRAVAKAQPKVFQYEFTRVNGVGRRSRLGAYHAADIVYNFGTLPDAIFGAAFGLQPGDFDETDARLSHVMSRALVSFVRTGSPNAEGLPQWPAFRDDERYIELGDRIEVKQHLRPGQLDVIDAVFAEQQERRE
jgi:para-nitrobenzyl esterase